MCRAINNSFFTSTVCFVRLTVSVCCFFPFSFLFRYTIFYGSFVFTVRRCAPTTACMCFSRQFLRFYTIFMLDTFYILLQENIVCVAFFLPFFWKWQYLSWTQAYRTHTATDNGGIVYGAHAHQLTSTPASIKTIRLEHYHCIFILANNFFSLLAPSLVLSLSCGSERVSECSPSLSSKNTIKHELHIIFTVKAFLYVFTFFSSLLVYAMLLLLFFFVSMLSNCT